MNQIIIYIKEKNGKTLKNGGKTLNKKKGWGKEKREQKKERRKKRKMLLWICSMKIGHIKNNP